VSEYRLLAGGLGDIYLKLENALDGESPLIVVTHYADIWAVLKPFESRLNIDSVQYIRPDKYLQKRSAYNIDVFRQMGVDLVSVRTSQYPKYDLYKNDEDVFLYMRPMLAFHPFGSKLSNEFWDAQGKPKKTLPNDCITYIVRCLEPYYRIVMFCTDQEWDSLSDRVKLHTTYPKNVPFWGREDWIKQCDVFLGSDSAIKTIAAAAKVPSYVFVGDYEDSYRDEVFLNPYIKDGVMEIFKYKDFSTKNFDPAIERLIEKVNGSKHTIQNVVQGN